MSKLIPSFETGIRLLKIDINERTNIKQSSLLFLIEFNVIWHTQSKRKTKCTVNVQLMMIEAPIHIRTKQCIACILTIAPNCLESRLPFFYTQEMINFKNAPFKTLIVCFLSPQCIATTVLLSPDVRLVSLWFDTQYAQWWSIVLDFHRCFESVITFINFDDTYQIGIGYF